MGIKKSRDRLVEELRRFIAGEGSREQLGAAAEHYDNVTRVKLQPALRQIVDVMKGRLKSETRRNHAKKSPRGVDFLPERK